MLKESFKGTNMKVSLLGRSLYSETRPSKEGQKGMEILFVITI